MMAKGRVASSSTSEMGSSKAKAVRSSESERLKVVTQDICITLSPCDLLSDINCDFSDKKEMVCEKEECQSAKKHLTVNFDYIKEQCGRKQTSRTSDKCNNNMDSETEESNIQNTDLQTLVDGFKPTSFYGSTTQKPTRRIQTNLRHGTVNLNLRDNHHEVKSKQCLGVKRKQGNHCNSTVVKKKPKTATDSKHVEAYSKQEKGSSHVDSSSCQAVEEKLPVNRSVEITKESAPGHQTEYSNIVTNSFEWDSESSISGANSLKWLGEDSEKSQSDSSSKSLVWDVKSPVKSQMVAVSEAQSVSSEESLESVLDGLFLKKKGSEYFFTDSIDSHALDLDQTPCTGNAIKESDEDISIFEVDADSSIVHQDATLFIKGSVDHLSDRPSTGAESESTSPRNSPDNQASIKRYFKSIQTPTCKTKLVPNGAAYLSPVESSAESKSRTPRKRKGVKKQEQMYLDLGQRDFGHVTCPTCGMVYTRAQPDDEAAHIKHHKSFVSGLRFSGWKNECVLQVYHDGRVIMIRPDDHSLHRKKVEEVRKVVDTELGFVADVPCRTSEAKTFLFIALKKIVGCAVAVQIDHGYPVLPSPEKSITPEKQITAWCCSTTPQTAQCGISRIWVHNQYRRKKIATRLLDCVRMNFIYGCIIPRELLAFSDPTPDGKRLAKSYAGTSQFLVFR